jgi:hypothetical protein
LFAVFWQERANLPLDGFVLLKVIGWDRLAFSEKAALGFQSSRDAHGFARKPARPFSTPKQKSLFLAAGGRSAAQLQYLQHPDCMVKIGMVNAVARNFYPPHFCVFFPRFRSIFGFVESR